MTVKELIEELQKCDPNKIVYVSDGCEYGEMPLETVSEQDVDSDFHIGGIKKAVLLEHTWKH